MPSAVQYKKLRPDDIDLFTRLIGVYEVVFEMEDFRMPPKAHLQQLLAREDFMVFVALINGEVVGGLTAYTLNQYYVTEPLVYIFDLAVCTQYQRRGVGRNLIRAINAYCTSIGVKKVFVQADQADDHALDFYRVTGGTSEQVVHFTYSLNQNK